MRTEADKRRARQHVDRVLADRLGQQFQESIYAPEVFGPPGGPFGGTSAPVKRRGDGIPRFSDGRKRALPDPFAIPEAGQGNIGLGVLRPEELEKRLIPRFRDREVAPLSPYLTAEERRLNCAAIDPADGNIRLVPREWWTESVPRGKLKPQEGNYDTITFHHTGRRETPQAVEELHLGTGVRGFAERVYRDVKNMRSGDQKMQTYGDFADIGYHFMIGPDGRIYEGRSARAEGAHVKHHNERNLGVAFLGDYTNAPLTDAQVQAAYNLSEAARKAYPIKRLATHGEFDPVKADELKGAIAQLRCLVR